MNHRVLVFAVLIAGSAHACPELEGAQPLFPTESAAPDAFVTIGDLPVSAPFEMTVEFCGDGSEQIKSLAFDAVMPAHQHGMNYRANVADEGGQSFRVSNVVLHMPGRWELRIDAETDRQKFTYTGEVLVE